MFGFLSIDWEKNFFPVQLVAKFSRVRCYLCKAMISFRELVNLPILSCLCQAFAMSSDLQKCPPECLCPPERENKRNQPPTPGKFLDLRRHLENSTSTMHDNHSAHTACSLNRGFAVRNPYAQNIP